MLCSVSNAIMQMKKILRNVDLRVNIVAEII